VVHRNLLTMSALSLKTALTHNVHHRPTSEADSLVERPEINCSRTGNAASLKPTVGAVLPIARHMVAGSTPENIWQCCEPTLERRFKRTV
jgi:hypothetical protein